MMKLLMRTTIFYKIAVCFLIALPSLDAYPFGAGGCPGAQAAPGELHRFGYGPINVTTGTLDKGGFVVLLDSTPLIPNAASDFLSGIPHELTIQATSGTFRGFLFRLSGGETGLQPLNNLGPLPGDPNAQTSIACVYDLVGGVTHTNNALKTSASAFMILSSPAKGLFLDVSVVVENRQGISIFYYTYFMLNAVAPPTPAPVPPTVAPTNAPVRHTNAPRKHKPST
jgi:hypothetical protein